jgi:class 3 adenylate cyclase
MFTSYQTKIKSGIESIASIESFHKSIPWYHSFPVRFLAMYTFFGLLVLSVSFLGEMYNHKQESKIKLGKKLQIITRMMASDFEANDFVDGKLTEKKREDVIKLFQKAKQVNDLDADLMRILKKTPQGYEPIFQIDPNAKYEQTPEILALYDKIESRKKGYYTTFYKTSFDTIISGASPMMNAQHEIVALIQIDLRLKVYKKNLFSELLWTYVISGTGLFLLICSLFWMWRTIKRKIEVLVKGLYALEHEAYHDQIKIDGHDEFAKLSELLNETMTHLQTKREMLKFLPSHTQKMIARVLEEGKLLVELQEAREVEIVVLETDIRGFSQISEKMSPIETIHLVNDYIGIQAQKIMLNQGSIDKYMGDAVLVVFEGDQKEQRALNCAFEIQQEIARLNAQRAKRGDRHVKIGIGMSIGKVVMGNMGCDSRMEHTVIGAVVNLASRLCSAALAGEIVVQNTLLKTVNLQLLDFHQQFGEIHSTQEKIKAKGFSEEIEICRFQYQTKI